MTKKHFKAIAAALLLIKDTSDRRKAVEAILPVLKESNPLFDYNKFMDAVNLL